MTALQARTRRAQQGQPLHRPARGLAPEPPGVELSVTERHDLIDLWTQLLTEVYVHYQQKKAMYGYDAVEALGALRRQIPYLDSTGFLRELTHTINRLRDQHTQLYLPGPGRDRTPLVAALPFLVETCGDDLTPTYLVTKVADSVDDQRFRPGVRLTTWNGVPFARALDLFADTLTGGRPDARRARALATITQRPLAYLPRPDELWVEIGYRTRDDGEGDHRIRFHWREIDPNATLQPPSIIELRTRRAVDATSEAARRARKLLFQPALWEQDSGPAAELVARSPAWLPTALPDAISARPITTSHGTYGYLRLWTFDLDHSDRYLDEVDRILRLLPPDGLIIDLRSNPGGVIEVAERLLQLFTTTRIEPVRFALRATPATAALVDADGNGADLADWASVRTALELGEEYSLHLPISDPERCNGHPIAYPGPVVAVVDPNTFSSGDIFTAGLADHGIAEIVAIGEATGAGGANVWGRDDIEYAYHVAGLQLPTCPKGLDYSLAVRRVTRSGTAAGLAIEDIGVTGDDHYTMTEDDILHGNQNLYDYCTQLLHSR